MNLPGVAQPNHFSSDEYRLLVESVEDYAIFMLDLQGRIVTWNPGARKIKGYTAEQIIGRHFSTFYTEEDRRSGKPDRVLEAARRTGHYTEEGERVRGDGSRFWASTVLTVLRDPSGQPFAFAKVTRDLTERRIAEETARELIREQTSRAVAEMGEARLQQSEQRYRELSDRLEIILEGMDDGITVQDSSGKIVFANRAGARICGARSVEELLASPISEIMQRFEMLSEDGSPFPMDRLPGRLAMKGEKSASAVMQVRELATGQSWWSSVRANAVRGPDGSPVLVINTFRDITPVRRQQERERYLSQATAALASSLDYEQMLATLARLLVPGFAAWCSIHLLEGERLMNVAVTHADSVKLALAPDFGRNFPTSSEPGRGLWQVIRSGRGELYAEIPDSLSLQGAHQTEHLQILRSLGLRSVIVAPIRVRDRMIGTLSLGGAGTAQAYDQKDLELAEELGRRAGISIDNARLYAAEKSAREHVALLARASETFSSSLDFEQMLQNIVHLALPSLGDFALLDVIRDRDVQRVCRAHEDPEAEARLQGSAWSRSEPTDQNLCALSSGEAAFHPEIDAAWWEEGAPDSERRELYRGLQICSLISVPLRVSSELLGALTLCFGKSGRHHDRDQFRLALELARRAAIALERLRLYRASQDAVRRAGEANRVKDEFLATVSHELRTPLTAILGWSTLLRHRDLDPRLAKGIDVIHRNALAQQRIIEDILDVSRIITGKLRIDSRPTDLALVTRDAIEVIRPSALAKQISIEFLGSDPNVLVADPGRLQQAVWNLLSNAVKFSASGGHIRIEIRKLGSRLVLSVSDTGKGIEPDFLPFVFDRFKQADSSTTRRYAGLGLGLALVRHIVELHGGSVSAESAGIGMGATFSMILPVRAVSPRPSSQPESPSTVPVEPAHPGDRPLTGFRVLVVDDDPDALSLLQIVLTEAGASVKTASSAARGFEILQEFLPQVLISDVGLPEEDGYAFVRRVRALSPSQGGAIPSLALTAYTRAEDRTKALAAGFTTHIGKPVHPDDLVAAVANLTAFVHR